MIKNKKIIIIFLVVILSFVGNSIYLLNMQIDGLLFFENYIEVEEGSVELNYIRSAYKNEKIAKITLPEFDNLNVYFEETEPSYLNCEKDKLGKHYVEEEIILNFLIDNEKNHNQYWDKFWKQKVTITELEYTMDTGKTGVVNVGEIILDFSKVRRGEVAIYTKNLGNGLVWNEKEFATTYEILEDGKIIFVEKSNTNYDLLENVVVKINDEEFDLYNDVYEVKAGDIVNIYISLKDYTKYYKTMGVVNLVFESIDEDTQTLPCKFTFENWEDVNKKTIYKYNKEGIVKYENKV